MAGKKRKDQPVPVELNDAETEGVVGGLHIEPVILERGNPTVGFQEPLVGVQKPSVGFQEPLVGFQEPLVGKK